MLKPGAIVSLVSPSHPFSAERLSRAEAVLADWGVQVVHEANVGARHRYLAGTTAQRRADLQNALSRPDVDGVWMVRGGSGMVHLVDGLDWSAVVERPVLGFSDATTLLVAMTNRRLGFPVHAPVVHSLVDASDDETLTAVRHFILSGTKTVSLVGTQIAGPVGSVEGRVVGGNLCVLASLCGTPSQVDATDAIVLLEEIGESSYKIDRALTQLVQSGAFQGAKGFAIGTFTNCWLPEDADWSHLDVVCEVLAPLGLPVVAGLPVGHGASNHPVPLGCQSVLHAAGLDIQVGVRR